MKILVIGQHFYPEQFKVNDICFQLVEDGHEVTVLTGLPNYPLGKVEKEYKWFKKRKENIRGVKVYRSWIFPRGTGKFTLAINYISFTLSASLKSLFLKKDFDIILVYQTSPVTKSIPGILLKWLTKKPLIIYCHDLWPESIATVGILPDSFIYKFLFKLSKWIYSKADKIFTSSKQFKDYFENTLGIFKETIYLPVYAEGIFETLQSPPKTDDSINLVFAGNIGKMQSVETIIYAANELKEISNVKWHIVGDGSRKKECEELSKKLKIQNIIFHGQHPITDMPEFYEMADAFLVTLKANKFISYTLPNKVQSYLAAGKPIIGAIDGETKMVINEANCGFCSSAEDFKSLSENVKQFVLEKNKHKLFGENARKYYEDNFSKQRYMERVNRLLVEIVEERMS